MFAVSGYDLESKSTLYEKLCEDVAHLIAGETNWIANLSNVSALLNIGLKEVNWVGFYLWDDGRKQLVLGPFQGKPACLRIDLGRGVCGAAALRQASIVVPDVEVFPGHIACDGASKAEVVIPMMHEGQLIGVLDVDSPLPNRFDEDDRQGLERVVAVLLKSL